MVPRPRSGVEVALANIEKLKQSVAMVVDPWLESPYYDEAEKWTFLFWNPEGIFRRLFDTLDLDEVVELACGYGRHAVRAAAMARRLSLIDVVDANLEKCRSRLTPFDNVSFVNGTGYDFSPLKDSTVSAIYCYDAMVHFSPDLVQTYIADAYRVLKPGGAALFHHSNYPAPIDKHYGLNPHARNHMTQALFIGYTRLAGMRVVESVVIPWGDHPDLDCVSLITKP